MSEPTHAPGWRGRPRRLGPIVGVNDPMPGERSARWIRVAAYVLAAGVVLIAGYAWAADAAAGHIQ